MAKLTPVEKRAVIKAATKGLKFLGQKMTAACREQIMTAAEEIKGTGKPFSKEGLALWSAKIDWAVANGDGSKIEQLISVPAKKSGLTHQAVHAAFYDSNGGCSCGGGGGGTCSW